MNEHDDERALRAAFARLREDEAQRAPSLEALLARGEPTRRRGWLRIAVPLAGAAAASLSLWFALRAPDAPAPQLAAADPPAPLAEPVIALGSLRSPTDALLAPPLAGLSREFSASLIPAPAPPPASGDAHSFSTPLRRFRA
jgi:hypothetical protein